jgi:hypothetical protein
LPVHRPLVEAVPCRSLQSRQQDIGHDGTNAKRLAGKADVERVTQEAAAAVGADEIAYPHDLLAGLASEPRSDAVLIMLQAHQFATELHFVAELDQALAHHAFGQELRHHQRDVVRLGRRRIHALHDIGFSEAAVLAIFALRRIEPAGRYDAVDDAKILENFLRARLDAFAA